ncbi:MAG: hypothetical protein HFJ19_01330 [Clostridia bacterium]|nr:hypothetical protein [Clostridia bacterium]
MKLLPRNPELYGAQDKLLGVRTRQLNVPEIMVDFVEYMGTIAQSKSPYKSEDFFVPASMWCLAKSAMDNIKSENASPEASKLLRENVDEIIRSRASLFDIIDQIANDEFARKFRNLNNPIIH